LGITRQALFNATQKGKLGTLGLESDGVGNQRPKNSYTAADFNTEYAKAKRKANFGDVKLPDYILEDMYGIEIVKPKPANVDLVPKSTPEPDNDCELEVTSMSDLKMLSNGQVREVLHPLNGLSISARRVWDVTIPDLVEMGTLNKSDLIVLKNYCATEGSIVEMETQLAFEGLILGNKINPLIGIVDKYRNSAKTLAISLNITSQGRKNLKLPDQVGPEEANWNKVLN